MSEHVGDVNDDTFEADVLNASGPVLVDFWAPWCGPCRTMSPIIEEIASEYEGSVTVKKLNVDESQATAASYEVLSIPSLFVFEGGEVKKRLIGALPKKKLLKEIEPWLGG